MAHDGCQHGHAQAPQTLVEEHGGGVLEKVPGDDSAGPQQELWLQGHPPVPQGVDRHNGEFRDAGQQRGQSGAGDPQGGGAQLAENEDVVQKRVQQHGDGEHHHAHEGIFRAALHADIDGAGGVEHVADAHDAHVGGAQLHQQGVVGDQGHDAPGEQQQRQRHQGGDGQAKVQGHAGAAVDGALVALAPVLAHQDGLAAEKAEDDDLDQEDGGVGGGDGGELVAAQKSHHEGVHKAQGGGDEILQDQRERQLTKILVKAGAPPQVAKHKITSR